MTRDEAEKARLFVLANIEELEHDCPIIEKWNPGFPLATEMMRDRIVQFRACLEALDAVIAQAASPEAQPTDAEIMGAREWLQLLITDDFGSAHKKALHSGLDALWRAARKGNM